MPGLETVEQYQRLFTDAAHWKPFVEEVCRHHGLEPSADIRTSPVPGTCPVFIVDEKYVVKFFGRLFNGHTSFAAERDAFYLLAQDTELPIPQLLAEGTLLTDGEWPYLISEWRSGQSVGKLRGGLSREAMTKVAAKTGRIAQRLHALPLHVTKTLKPNWDAFADLLEKQRPDCAKRHAEWGHLPPHLLEQIDAFLLPSSQLIDRRTSPKLLHADLTADHILLEKENDDWHISALIDFGDAIVGDPLFELIPVYLDLLDRDKELLRIFVAAYGLRETLDHAQALKLLNFCLLHPFDVFDGLFERTPAGREIPDLESLAHWLWQHRRFPVKTATGNQVNLF
ncbi:MAG: hygromycin-B 7''-O-kinase [Candidatus Latescibacterota bacterium]|jgi:hygromycin-B 7''-O-kinase